MSTDSRHAAGQQGSAGGQLQRAAGRGIGATLRDRRQADPSQLATEQDLALLEQRIIIKLGVMLVAAVAVTATLAQLLR